MPHKDPEARRAYRRAYAAAHSAEATARAAAWKKANPEAARTSARRRSAARRAAEPGYQKRINATQRKRRTVNIERTRAECATWQAANREKANACSLAWAKKNPGKRCAYTNKRRARKLNATPVWADQAAIDAHYKDAARRRLTVDHIVPLQSPIVCGLHVEHNLQLLSKSENSAKGNRFNV